jgi:CHAT domain-containing protein/tetratricopeptide (TPR) repeat protein
LSSRAVTQHLSEGELDALLDSSASAEADTGRTTTQVSEEVRNHLAVCKECQQKLDMHQSIRKALRGARSAEFKMPPGHCVDENTWAEVAAGVRGDDESMRLLEHAATCRSCGALLKHALATLHDEPTADEEALLAGLKSQQAQWAEALAAKLKQAEKTEEKLGRRQKTTWRLWLRPSALAFASFVVLAAVIGWQVARIRLERELAVVRPAPATAQEAPGALVALAYRDYRTMDYRIAGAQFAQMHPVQRGVAPSIADLPPSMLDATKAIREGLERNPADSQLLDRLAQLELLNGNPDRAIVYLAKARENAPDSPAVLTDLATAYMLSADQSDARSKQGLALNLLGQVLAKSPNDQVALYNYALALEKLHLYSEAIKAWSRFTVIETDENWKKDGLAHRDYLVQHGLTEERFKNPAGHNLGAALQDMLGRPKRLLEPALDALNDESYLSDALTDWLPAVVDSSRIGSSHDGSLALVTLEAVLREQHHDEMLGDLLAGPRGSPWTQGAKELSAAMRANLRGEPQEVVAHAVSSISFFRQAKNKAGEAAARFEWLSGINRLQMADRCAPIASASLKMLDLPRYPWVNANLLFEASTCDFMAGKQEEALEYARRARRVADRSHYKVLGLEGEWILDGVSTPWIATHDAWNRISAGLDEFWHYPYPALAGEGFYTDLGYAAQVEGWWYCAEAVFRESVAIHSSHGDTSVSAAAHHLLGKAAEAAGDEQMAEAEYSEAESLLGSLGKSAEPAQLELAIERASIEVRRNDLSAADTTLKEVAPKLSLVSNHYALIPYLGTIGELHLRSGNSGIAEKELWNAIQLVEQDTSSLQSDTDILTWHRDSSQAYRSLVRLYLEAYRQDDKAFSLLEWYRAAPLRLGSRRNAGSHIANREPEKMKAAQYLPDRVAIGARSAVLTWILFPNSVTIFLLDRNGLHTSQVHLGKDELNLTVQSLARLCADPTSDIKALDHQAGQVYAWLVEPMERYLDGIETLTVEPDEGMEAIPFQVLRSGKGEYLGSRVAIVESPGLGYEQMLRADKRISSASVMLAVGDPQQNGATRLLPLPDASREATTIAGSFVDHFLFTGRQAVLANVSKRLPQAEIFHFAGHAISERDETGLVLADNPRGMLLLDQERLGREDLNRLKLVVMSGCETGVAGEGLIDPGNLVRVFLRAGVPDVVASKWKVDSYMSARLLEETYQGLLQGKPIENAMAAAEASLRAVKPHPYYWAAFSVFGR